VIVLVAIYWWRVEDAAVMLVCGLVLVVWLWLWLVSVVVTGINAGELERVYDQAQRKRSRR
jgi:uncharacterized membrane protein SpoIIM required for sporulation